MKVVTRKRIDQGGIRRILVRGVNWVGDAVMTTPALAGIRQTFPGATITLLVKPWVAGVFAGNPHIDEILLYDSMGRHRGLAGLLRLAQDLRGHRFDLAVLLQNAFEAALLAFLAGIPHRIGYDTQGRGLLLSTAVIRDRSIRGLHHVDYYQALVGALGWIQGEGEPRVYPGGESEAQAWVLLERMGVKGEEGLFAFNPGSTYGSAKRWPAERYAALADRLIEDLGVSVLLTGAAADGEVARAVQSSAHCAERILDLTGRTDIPVLAAVLKRCALFVTNDTGAMHVAAAVGVPVVAIFGPTDAAATSPVGRHVLIRHRVPCSPCLLRECPIDHRCMGGISVDDVLSYVIDTYNRSSKVSH
jgi:heptosyltransferase II